MRVVNAPSEWVSVTEAARRLKLSPSEVRRRIRVGTLQGERHPRGPGDTRDRFMVLVPTVGTTPNDAPTDAQPRTEIERALDIFDALLRANGDTFERQADQIADLSSRLARAETERNNALAEVEKVKGFQRSALDRAHESFEKWLAQVKELSAERQRADTLDAELSHLRINHRRAVRLLEEMKAVADAQEARANDLAEARRQIAERDAEARRQLDARDAEAQQPWWRRWLGMIE